MKYSIDTGLNVFKPIKINMVIENEAELIELLHRLLPDIIDIQDKSSYPELRFNDRKIVDLWKELDKIWEINYYEKQEG